MSDDTEKVDQVEPEEATGLAFSLTDEGSLMARYVPPREEGPMVDEGSLRMALSAAGHGRVALFDDRLQEFLKRCRSSQPVEIIIGGNRDAAIKVEIPSSALHAYGEIQPRVGSGKPLDQAGLAKALNDARVKSGVLDEGLQQAMALSETADGPCCLPLARGQQAVPGEDARIEPLFPSVADRRPRIDASGRADYRELGGVDEVTPGVEIVQLVPATAGQAGMTVTGKKLPARNGKPLNFRALDNSVEASPERPGVMLSKITGRPVIDSRGIKVEPVLQMTDIDVGTGNVRFSGTVVVKGDVKTGMRVESSGDIQVFGTVEAAELSAAGAVEVKGGVIGHGAVRDEQGRMRPEAAVIRAGGTVSARFLENAFIDSGESIVIQDRVGHSELNAANEVLVGKAGRSKGQIIGGSTRARYCVRARILGSPASVRTQVEVGFTGDLKEKINQVAEHLQEQQDRFGQIKTIFERLARHPDAIPAEKVEQLKKAARQIKEEIDAYQMIRDQLENAREQAEAATVVAESEVFNNVAITIAGISHTVREDRRSVEFILEEGEVVYR